MAARPICVSRGVHLGKIGQEGPALTAALGNSVAGTYSVAGATVFLQVFKRTSSGVPVLVFSGNVVVQGNNTFTATPLLAAIAAGDVVFATITVGGSQP